MNDEEGPPGCSPCSSFIVHRSSFLVGSFVSSRAFIAIAAIAAGVFIAWLIAPFVFVHLPNDRDQIGTVVRLIRTHPKVAVVGNSVAMYGVHLDANLATPGQSITESVLIASELRDTRTIIMVVTPWQLATSSSLNAQGWNAWWMYGLRPSAETRALTGMPAMSDAVERFRSRWIVRAAFESMFARGRPTDEVWQGSETFAVDPHQRALIESIAARRPVVVVLAPLSPVVRTHYTTTAVRFTNVRTIDATDLLTPAEFMDATHPNAAGAKKLTQFIEERL
jgi:hypothetical protein